MENVEETESSISQQSLQFNNLINTLMQNKDKLDETKIDNTLTSLFDIVLWAEKKNPTLLSNALETKFLSFIVQQLHQFIPTIIKGFTLLLGNCKQLGILSHKILEERVGDKLIIKFLQFINQNMHYEQQQYLHFLASFLKAYNRHLNQTTYQYYIDENNRFIFLEICCKFYNCPQEITRTSLMNILMNILKLSYSYKFLQVNGHPRKCLKQWCYKICKLFKNELKNFDHQLIVKSEEDSDFLIHLINDKILLWEDLSQISNNLFSRAFFDEVILPLLIGSLNTEGTPLFTLKFTLFIITKLIKAVSNLGILNEFGQLMFTSKDIRYTNHQLQTADLRPFSLKQILLDEQNDIKQDQKMIFSGIGSFFFNVLKSKDSRFLEAGCNLLFNLIKEVRSNKQSLSFYLQSLGFGINGQTITTLSEILINQLSTIHSLQTIKIICSVLAYIQPSKYLINDNKNLFVHIFQSIAKETITSLDKNRQFWSFIVEIFEYDAKILSSPNFCFEPTHKNDFSLLFNNNMFQNENLPFYKQIPQSNQNVLRYQIVKTLLLQKLSRSIIEQFETEKTLEKYVIRVKSHDEKYIKPGQFLKLPITVNTYRCKIVDDKTQIPNCLLIDDQTNFILGFLNSMEIKIIINIKFKHLSVNIRTKRDKLYFDIKIKKFDFQHSQSLVDMSEITLKQLEVSTQYFKVKKIKILDQQISFLFDLLKKCLQKMPEISLI